ncbi:MAG TPA: hypothetical protein VKE25_16585 [Actinomycetes bacterium]|nr:hypothetical protein [Actinomycetes bacterium]
MSDAVRWLCVVILVLLVAGLIAWARGPDHHRGPQQVGALGSGVHSSWISTA